MIFYIIFKQQLNVSAKSDKSLSRFSQKIKIPISPFLCVKRKLVLMVKLCLMEDPNCVVSNNRNYR